MYHFLKIFKNRKKNKRVLEIIFSEINYMTITPHGYFYS